MRQLVYGCWLIGMCDTLRLYQSRRTESRCTSASTGLRTAGQSTGPRRFDDRSAGIHADDDDQPSWIVRKTPRELVNIPNRDYWLADETRGETVTKIGEHCLVLSLMLQVFFRFLHQRCQSV